MTHLDERITDFIFAELSAAEMNEAQRHIGECSDCRKRVEQFGRTHAMLKTSPDIEPPRIVFEVEKRHVSNIWRWLVPAGVAAATLITVLAVAPPNAQWNGSQFIIAFGPAPAVTPEQSIPAAAQQPEAQQAGYDSMLKELAKDLDKRNVEQVKKIRRLQDQKIFVEATMRQVERASLEMMIAGVQE